MHRELTPTCEPNTFIAKLGGIDDYKRSKDTDGATGYVRARAMGYGLRGAQKDDVTTYEYYGMCARTKQLHNIALEVG